MRRASRPPHGPRPGETARGDSTGSADGIMDLVAVPDESLTSADLQRIVEELGRRLAVLQCELTALLRYAHSERDRLVTLYAQLDVVLERGGETTRETRERFHELWRSYRPVIDLVAKIAAMDATTPLHVNAPNAPNAPIAPGGG